MLKLKNDNGQPLPQDVQDRVNSFIERVKVEDRDSSWNSALASALASARKSAWVSACDSYWDF